MPPSMNLQEKNYILTAIIIQIETSGHTFHNKIQIII